VNGYDNTYSRFVAWSKVILPTAALSLLSTLFLFSKGRNGEGDIPIAQIEEIARDTKLTGPKFAGVNAAGTAFSLSAASARPRPGESEIYDIDRINAQMKTTDGVTVDFFAGQGEMNSITQNAVLSNLVRIESSTGYQMETTGLIALFDKGTVESTGPLEVRSPFGALTAGHMIFSQATSDAGSEIVFNQGVRLIYQPEP
jgi:lipopolysaccharide export system protein LptC